MAIPPQLWAVLGNRCHHIDWGGGVAVRQWGAQAFIAHITGHGWKGHFPGRGAHESFTQMKEILDAAVGDREFLSVGRMGRSGERSPATSS
jgi:hypothetical protein